MNYISESNKIKKYLETMMDSGDFTMKDMASIGGAAFVSLYLEKMAEGEVYKIKKKVRYFFDYMFKYEMSNNPIYLNLAEDELKYIEWCYNRIEDKTEKANASKIVEMAKKEFLKAKSYLTNTSHVYVEKDVKKNISKDMEDEMDDEAEDKPKTYFERV